MEFSSNRFATLIPYFEREFAEKYSKYGLYYWNLRFYCFYCKISNNIISDFRHRKNCLYYFYCEKTS